MFFICRDSCGYLRDIIVADQTHFIASATFDVAKNEINGFASTCDAETRNLDSRFIL